MFLYNLDMTDTEQPELSIKELQRKAIKEQLKRDTMNQPTIDVKAQIMKNLSISSAQTTVDAYINKKIARKQAGINTEANTPMDNDIRAYTKEVVASKLAQEASPKQTP